MNLDGKYATDADCNYDYVEITDADVTPRKYCGDRLPPKTIAIHPGQHINVTFRSNQWFNYDGWRLEWSAYGKIQ